MKSKILPSQKRLKEDFTYNPETGEFIRYDGKFGCINKAGYCNIFYNKERYYVHRLIWKWWYGEEPEHIDHINGDKLDNSINNLRSVTHAANRRNSKKDIRNKSGFTGISWSNQDNRWKSTVTINNKTTCIGLYKNKEEAHKERLDYLNEFYPNEFTARHGK